LVHGHQRDSLPASPSDACAPLPRPARCRQLIKTGPSARGRRAWRLSPTPTMRLCTFASSADLETRLPPATFRIASIATCSRQHAAIGSLRSHQSGQLIVNYLATGRHISGVRRASCWRLPTSAQLTTTDAVAVCDRDELPERILGNLW
jgi:hypothetical protein